ncbi:TPA: extracellular solute-binding protein [Campylobacter jejuni]|nr:extracellular solute-binding protein [Campylobacter jejuni]HEH6326459.1 extracellular solute-binding protein [Campylobacter jejuni]
MSKKFFLSLGFVALLFSNSQAIDENLIKAAQAEGRVNSLAMPDTWADLKNLYGIEHSDTDMSSAQEIAKFKAEKKNASGDIGDVGASFGEIAVKQGVAQPFKTSYWDQIPTWAKDKDGNWLLAYTGTIAFIVNKDVVKDILKTWQDLLKGNYKITVGDVSVAAQAVSAVLAANYALGGDEKDLSPALAFFNTLAKQGRLVNNDVSIANLEKGEVEVGLVWDFNGLGYRDKVGKDRYEVLIPADGSVISGYTTIINKYAKHPNAAKLAREFILSDKGQINLAKGYARPIRIDHITLPDDIKAKLLPSEQYKNARAIKDQKAWEKSAKELPQLWQEKVIVDMK